MTNSFARKGRMRTAALIPALLMLVGGGAAVAQPGSGENLQQRQATLSAGFLPDPFVTEVVAGGTVDATVLGGNCTGWIGNGPNFYLTYTAGSGALSFTADGASTDTTLYVQDPRGARFCDDDSAGYPDPRVVIEAPISGVYQVWVGTYFGQAGPGNHPTNVFGVRLSISDTVSLPAGILLGPNVELQAPVQVPVPRF